MPVSDLITTPTAFNANSYISLLEANQYFLDRQESSDWTSATDDTKKQALIEATKLVDNFRYAGEKYYDYQNLMFPRNWSSDFFMTVEEAGLNYIQTDSMQLKESYPSDFWNGGIIEFRSQDDPLYLQKYEITDFDQATGRIYATFPSTPTVGKSVLLVFAVPDEIKWAVCETAIWIIQGKSNVTGDPNIKSKKLGDESVSYFEPSTGTVYLPDKAMDYVNKYRTTSGTLLSSNLFR